jgi:2'-5' RNA ligase
MMDEASLPVGHAELAAPRYGLFIQVPEVIGAELAAHTRHVPGTSLPPQGYHVTVYGPFVFLESPEDTQRILREVLGGASPFTLQLGGIGSFSAPEDNAVFIRVTCTPALLRLHARLVNAIGDRVRSRHPQGEEWETWGWVPHVSLGLHIPDALLAPCLEGLSSLRSTYDFTVRGISLMQETPGYPWRWLHVERYSL